MSNHHLENCFEEIFRRSLVREGVDFYEKDLSEIFGLIAAKLLCASPSRKGLYIDRTVALAATVKTSRQVEFHGEMWVGGNREQWSEPCRAGVHAVFVDRAGVGGNHGQHLTISTLEAISQIL
jgi:hypothetical protein